MINSTIQIILSVFLIAIMAFISYSVYNNEIINNIKLTSTNKKSTVIFSGVLDYTQDKDVELETYDKTNPTYIDINSSINQNGGAEYSYNFWLFFDTLNDMITSNTNTGNESITNAITTIEKKNLYITLFHKGENNIVITKDNNYDCQSNSNIKSLQENIFIKNPLVKIRNDATEVIVEYNNINFPETYNSSAKPLNCNDDVTIKNTRNTNKFGIKDIVVNKYKQSFNMITIVFQERPKNEDIFNLDSANCKVYFNGVLVADRLANTSSIEHTSQFNNIKSRVMKSNLSKLHINPLGRNKAINNISNINSSTNANKKEQISPLQVADLTYFNYALNLKEIISLYNKGYNTNSATFKTKTSKYFSKGKYYNTDGNDSIKGI